MDLFEAIWHLLYGLGKLFWPEVLPLLGKYIILHECASSQFAITTCRNSEELGVLVIAVPLGLYYVYYSFKGILVDGSVRFGNWRGTVHSSQIVSIARELRRCSGYKW